MSQALLAGFTHESSKTDEWFTPPWIFDRLGLSFYLDPAMPLRRLSWVPAEHYFTAADNGLVQPWAGRVWLNPPYGQQTGAWLRRFVEHGDGVARFTRPWPALMTCASCAAGSASSGPTARTAARPALAPCSSQWGAECVAAVHRGDFGTSMKVTA